MFVFEKSTMVASIAALHRWLLLQRQDQTTRQSITSWLSPRNTPACQSYVYLAVYCLKLYS